MGALIRLVMVVAIAYAAYNYLRRFMAGPPPSQAAGRSTQASKIHDLAACSLCGTYVSPLAGPCGKAGCPAGVRQPG
jgi:hypothetical protein